MLQEILPLCTALHCYTTQAYAIARKHLQAIQVLREMQQRGVQPNAVCYGAAINACTRNG
jgi:pentatricopeptide repeat protein